MSKEPFLPMFVGDFLAATSEWEGEERALYSLLLIYQWAVGSLPADTRKLAKMIGYTQKNFDVSWTVVSQKFQLSEGRLLNTRLEKHREKTKSLSEKNSASGKKGAESRWRKDGERHDERHSEMDGERYQSAITQRYQKSHGVTHSNPSHPIQEEESKSGKPAFSVDPREQIFNLGKTILGPDAGSLIAKAIKASDEATVGAVLGEMALRPKADPRAYFVAATKPKERGFVV